MSNELPQEWEAVRLGEIVDINPRHQLDLDDNLKVSFAPMACISETAPDFTSLQQRRLGEVRKGFTHFAEGDVLFAKITPCMENGKGAVARNLCNGIGCGTTELHVLRPRAGIDPYYIYHFTHQKSFRAYARSSFAGTAGQLRVPVNFLNDAEVPLPPLPEQRRIMAKLGDLLELVEVCQKRLDRIPLLLKRFRQSVVEAACSGMLTEDWRIANFKNGDQPEAGLPQGWVWNRVDALLQRGGLFDGPFGSNLKTADYTDSGVRVIRLENVGQLRFNAEKEIYISQQKYRGLAKHTVEAGDIVFASFVDEEVRACVVPELPTKAIAKADCFCIRPQENRIDRYYLAFQLVSRKSFDRLLADVHGATRPRINTKQLRQLEIRVCSLAEQKQIVRRVDQLFSVAGRIEERYFKAKAQFEKLDQSILAKAFRGELVPQDSNDEPAMELLDSIKAGRGASPHEPRRKGSLRKN